MRLPTRLVPRSRHYVTRNRRHFLSTADAVNTPFDFRTSRLGLIPSLVRPSLEMLLQLPEVQPAVQVLQGRSPPTFSLEEDLERASQVLQSMGPTHYHAVLALQAEVQQRTGNHAEAQETIATILKEDPNNLDLQLAQAKTAWYTGDFETTQQICNTLLEADDIHEMPLYYASALSGFGLGKLMACHSLDEAYTCRDPIRMALKFLPQYNLPLPLLAAHLNMGIAEIVYGQIVGQERKVKVPVDAALRIWSEGLQLMERQNYQDAATAAALEQRLHTNMAVGILMVDDGMDDIVPEASEHAGKALASADQDTDRSNDDKEFLKRILTVVATCYHKSGKAVTAEGLLQSALSLPGMGDTLSKIDQRSAYESYSNLCQDWEKRQGDADKMKQKAQDAEQELPETWRGKSAVASSAWFWTPGEFES